MLRACAIFTGLLLAPPAALHAAQDAPAAASAQETAPPRLDSRLGGLPLIPDARPRSIAAENPTGQSGEGGMAVPNPSFSGIYPHLAYFNNEGECGTGAVVPWAGKLWVVTYGPHLPKGSSDKLYEITPDLAATVRPESIGGTPANRLIHKESSQLFIGPYAVDACGQVRAIPYTAMFGRHTANMRHLTDPANKIYYATMEEGFYEVDVKSLDVKELYQDGNAQQGDLGGTLLPGYHGKGAYSGQGRVVYANNGQRGPEALQRPDIPSGVLAEWDGKEWNIVRRNQFTEVTGPGGIYGNPNPATDPIWSIGWDHRSLILMLLDAGTWHAYRLPKASHTYDGAHGWNTEWPRIRDIGESDLLMTMHGMFWRFPKTFSWANSAGIRPRSTYLKVIGDFCRWRDRLVFGCDDTAKSEFLNKRQAKGNLAEPGQSQSNLWFAEPAILDQLGPAVGRGALWVEEAVQASTWSDLFLFAGYERRAVHLVNGDSADVTFEFAVDAAGNNQWKTLTTRTVKANSAAWLEFTGDQTGEWVRVKTDKDCAQASAVFHFSRADRRVSKAEPVFAGIARVGDAQYLAGLVRTRGDNKRTLSLAAMNVSGNDVQDVGYYELGADMKLRRIDDPQAQDFTKSKTAIPQGVLTVDAGSVVYVDDKGKRWRLPKGDAAFDELTGAGLSRIDREVVTERDLFNAHGTFYELPAENAGGFAKIRPVATHNRRIFDYCSYRGLMIMTGIVTGGEAIPNPHLIRSDDGQAVVWAGVIDDLWKFGKAVGRGGPWKNTAVKASAPSDPYLINNYDRRRLELSQPAGTAPVNIRVEVDITGDGHWVSYNTFEVPGSGTVRHDFPAAFHANWIRFTADQDGTMTAWLIYE